MNSRFLTVALLGLGLLLAALIVRSSSLAWLALPFLTYLGAAVLGAPVLDKLRLSAERTVDIVEQDGAVEIAVAVTVRSAGAAVAPLKLSDPLLPGMVVTDGSLKQWAALPAGGTAGLQYRFRAERGSFSWKTVLVELSDPFGLFVSHLELPASGEICVQPRARRIRPIALRPDSTLHSPGTIPARLGGSGTDFWGIREYVPGDPLRHIDWRLTARHPHEYFTKEFEQEEIADIGLILDARPRADLRIGTDSLFEHSVNAIAGMAEMFLHQGHRVSLLVFGDPMTAVFPGYSKRQLNRILNNLARVQIGSDSSHLSLDLLPLRFFSTRALLVVLSPLSTGDWSFFPRLRAHGNQGLLISPDPIHFARNTFRPDPATRLAIRAARVERRIELQKIARLHVRVVDWQVEQPLAPLVRSALGHVRGQRLRETQS
jgi:uncharacterized protein (DUF58 family)